MTEDELEKRFELFAEMVVDGIREAIAKGATEIAKGATEKVASEGTFSEAILALKAGGCGA